MDRLLAIDVTDESYTGFIRVSRGDSLPFESLSMASASAFDFLEHIPRNSSHPGPTAQFVGYMQEICRVLEPGGVFVALTPAFPSIAAFSDPTHVNFITEETHKYFSDEAHAVAMNYGFTGSFRTLVCRRVSSTHWLFNKLNNPSIRSEAERRLSAAALYFRCAVKLRSPRTHLLWILEKTEPRSN